MKKNRFISIMLIVVVLSALTVSTIAVQYSSDQINTYSVDVKNRMNTIDVILSVTGTSTMNKLGCESISIYEKTDTRWTLSDELSLSENDSGMSKYNATFYRNTIYCNKSSATEYKVVVTVFAEDDQGCDIRTKTFYV